MAQKTHLLTGRFAAGAVFLLLLVVGGWFASPMIRQRFEPPRRLVHLQTQPQFKVKRHSELLGVNVMQITDKQEPQDFLVMDNVPATMIDPVLGHDINKGWATDVANQFLKKRDPDSSTPPPTVEIQQIKTVPQGTVLYEGKNCPYWQVQVQFKLSQESASRNYEGGVIRYKSEDGEPDTLILGYAQKGAFRKELLPQLMGKLSFEKVNGAGPG